LGQGSAKSRSRTQKQDEQKDAKEDAKKRLAILRAEQERLKQQLLADPDFNWERVNALRQYFFPDDDDHGKK
jgi:hypothetical protein